MTTTEVNATSYQPTTLPSESTETEDKKKTSPTYHAIIKKRVTADEVVETDIVTETFQTKRDLYKGLNDVDPDDVYAVFRGKKMDVGVKHLYTVE